MNFPDNEYHVAIIGAGISGLATAVWLDAAGVKVLVLENAPHVGGVMRSERFDDFLIETGPNSLLETTPHLGELIALAGVQEQVVYPDGAGSKRYILRRGKIFPLPTSPSAFLATPLFSLRAKLRLLREPFVKPAPPEAEESIAEFVRRRIGGEFLDYAINPFVAGVYAGDPAQLSVRAAFPKLHALEQNYGSLIRGAIRGRKERAARAEKAKDRARMLSFREGMGALPAALYRRLREKVQLGANNVQISPAADSELSFSRENDEPDKIWRIAFETTSSKNAWHEIYARHVVITAPAYHVPALFSDGPARRLAALRDVVYAPVAIVTTGFRREQVRHPLDGFGFLVPEKEQRRILGTLFNSTLFPNRAPEGRVLMTTFVGGMRQPDFPNRDDRELRQFVLEELRDILGVAGAPEFLHIRRYQQAIPQYLLGHQRFVDLINEAEREFPGLHFATNYRGGISVADCIKQAAEMAAKIQTESNNAKRTEVLKIATKRELQQNFQAN
ncbi:MAG: protoporphyrinogen oxidase [candidate division KSB1 bacterium]|nr:protoporphyrinogen oxidase [candidate division KSB1 bacterium]